MKIAILSNINSSLIAKELASKYEVYQPAGYNTWVQEILDTNSELYRFEPKAIFILLDGYELTKNSNFVDEGIQELNTAFTTITTLADNFPDSAIFISSLDIVQRRIMPLNKIRPERVWEWHWYNKVNSLVSEKKNIFIADIKELVEKMGRDNFYSSKLWYTGCIPYSLKGITVICKRIESLLFAWQGQRYKCLVLDLDNTLWGGVIGEEGIDGIELSNIKEGSRYRDFQLRLRELKDTGIILAISSKNNMEDVIDVLNNHPHMVLKVDDFVVIKANWQPKPKNIRDIALELNIGLNSFVFIDDNPVEQEAVRRELEDVIVLDFPKDTTQLEKMLLDAYEQYFLTLNTTLEDSNKTRIYQEELKRKKAMSSAASLDDYIKSLNIEVFLHLIKEEEVERVAQLTQKTNQFNLTIRRYTVGDIRERMKSHNWRIYTASVCDKFGDSGLISVLMLELKGNTAIIDTFLMSCRVMNRYIEDCIISEVENNISKEGICFIEGEYIPTPKNIPVKDLYDRLGYILLLTNEDGSKIYRISLPSNNNNRKKLAKVTWEEV